QVGCVGVGNRGDQLLDALRTHDDCDIVALCDVYKPYLKAAREKVGDRADTYSDYRKLLERKDLNAVVIATPDHWHALQFVAAFNRNRCLYKFRWFWDYSGGQLTNFGTHYLDVIQWALDQYAPRGVFCTGGKYAIRDNRQIPDTLEAVWEYDGALVTFSQFNA